MPEVNNASGKTEDIVLISVMVMGFLGSVCIYVFSLSVPPIVVAILLGAAISALVYRFLGGIPASTMFGVGALKLGGSLAALIGSAWFINQELTQQTTDLASLFEPNYNQWSAISNKDLNPLPVTVKGLGTLPAAAGNAFQNIPLALERDDQQLKITSAGFTLGYLAREEVMELPWQIDFETGLTHFLVTERLPADSSDINLDPLPFHLSTGVYGGEYSRYQLSDKSGEIIHSGSIYRKQTEIISWQDKNYLVAVVEVNHLPQQGPAYAKFAFGEIKPKLDMK